MTSSPLPFKRQWAYHNDSPQDVLIKACKGMINALFKWKEMKVDAEGNVYKPEDHIERAVEALSILITFREITPEQLEGILNQLGIKK